MQYLDWGRSSAGPRSGKVAALYVELGSGKRGGLRRAALSRRIRSTAQRSHQPLPLQGHGQARQNVRMGSDGPRTRRLGGTIQGAQAQRLSRRGEPGNTLAWRRHSGKIIAEKLVWNEETFARSRCHNGMK